MKEEMKDIGALRTGNAARHALEALALRCEAEEPSDELNAAIKAAVIGGGGMPKPYGTSLDAAVKLVPEGWFPLDLNALDEGLQFCLCNHARDLVVHATAKTEPMARCAAALRARAALAEQSRESMQSGEANPPPQGSAP